MKSRANGSFRRWVLLGAPLIIGIAILAAFVLRSTFGLPLAKLALPIAVLIGIQLVFFMTMCALRQRYRRTRDLRIGLLTTGMYGLSLGLAGMYYAGELGIVGARTFGDNYIGFAVYMGVVTCISVVAFSFVRPKRD